MKRFITATLLALGLAACATFTSIKPIGVVKLSAAALPYTATFTWNANPSTELITGYQVKLDGVASTIPLTACTATTCTTQLVLTTRGAHAASVAGINLTLTGDPGVTGVPQIGVASTLNMVLNVDPTKPTGTAAQ